MAEQKETIVLDFEVDLEDSIESIDKLTAANKELRKERNALNLSTESGKKRASEINAVIDQNTSKIKANSSAIEQQRANIGNYRSALDGVHPALGKVGQGLEAGTAGFKAMTMQALRFIATPIGAILAAIVAVFSLLKAAISQNNELLDKFENITNAVGTVLQVIIGRVAKLGEALIALATGDFNKAIDLTAQAFGGLAEEIGNAVAQSQLYLDLSRDLEDAQRALRLETARQENEIKRLVVAAKNRNLSFDEQEELLRRALSLEEQLVEKRAENAQKDLVITAKRIALDRQLSQTENETFEEFVNRLVTSTKLGDDQIDSIIDKIEALEQARGSSLAFQEKLENSLATIQEKRAAALEKQNEALREQEALNRATERAANIEDVSTDDPLIGAFQTRANVITDIEDKLQDDLKKRKDKAANEDIIRARKSAEMEVEIERTKFGIIGGLLGSFANLAEDDSVAHRALASAQALVNTYLASTAALASGSEINPVFGILSAAAAIANGLAAVARINGVELAEGGAVLRGPSHEKGGIPIVAEGEEIILTKGVYRNPYLRSIASRINVAAGGRSFADGGLVSNSVTQPINQQLELSNIIKAIPPQEISVKEVTRVQNRVKAKEKLSKR